MASDLSDSIDRALAAGLAEASALKRRYKLAAQPSFAEQHLNREVPQPSIRYDILSDYADKHRLHFNDLCRVVREAVSGVSASDGQADATKDAERKEPGRP